MENIYNLVAKEIGLDTQKSIITNSCTLIYVEKKLFNNIKTVCITLQTEMNNEKCAHINKHENRKEL